MGFEVAQHVALSADVRLVSACPTMDLVAVVTADECLSVYRAISWERLFRFNAATSMAKIAAAVWHPNGRCIALGDRNGSVLILDTESGEPGEETTALWAAEEEGHLVDLQWHCVAASRDRMGLFVALSSAGTVALGFAASCTALARLPREETWSPTSMVATSDCSAFSVAVGTGTGPSPPVAACLSFRVDPVLEVLPGVMFVTSACAAMRHYTAALHGAFADARQALLAVRKTLRFVFEDAAESLKTHGEAGERVPGVPEAFLALARTGALRPALRHFLTGAQSPELLARSANACQSRLAAAESALSVNALSAARGVEAVAEEACARAAVDPRVEDMGLDAAALRSASNHAAQTLEEGRGALITVCADVTNLMAWLWQASSDATETEDSAKPILRYDVQRVDAVLSALREKFPEEEPAAGASGGPMEEEEGGLLGGGASWLRAAATGSAEAATAAPSGCSNGRGEEEDPAQAMADALLSSVLDVAGRGRNEGALSAALLALDEFSGGAGARASKALSALLQASVDEGVRAAAPELARGIWLRLAPVGHPGEGVPSAVPRATWTWEQGPPAGGADSGRGLLAGLSPEGALRVGALAESADRSALVIRPDGAAGVNQTAALTASTAHAAAPVFAATSMAQQGSPHSVVAAAGVHEDGQSALYVVKNDTLVGGDSGDEEGREDPSEWTRLPSGQEVMAPEPVEDAPLALSASGARGLIAVGWGRRLLVLLADDDDDDEDEGEDGDED